MLTSQGAEVRQPEATSERSSAEFCVHLRQRPRPPSGLKCLKHMLQVIAIKQLNRDGNQGNKEFLVVVLMEKALEQLKIIDGKGTGLFNRTHLSGPEEKSTITEIWA
nr:uncharacterized protein LOC127311804 [Lolium perenne]